jgi:predicted NAD/FAD-binding protein
MIKDILRFNQESKAILNRSNTNYTLGQYLLHNNYSNEFINHYIIPMGAAIWSSAPEKMMEFPAFFFIRFLNNHGMLSVDDRPMWHVIKNGSNSYVEKLTHSFKDRIHLNTAIKWIKRYENHVLIKPYSHEVQRFDHVFLACHSDQALKLLSDPTADEIKVLGAIPYQNNEAVLHTDISVLPKKRLAWAAWNYHILKKDTGRVALTYNMNILQNIKSKHTFCVTLNNTAAIDPEKIIKRINYDHPVFTLEGMDAQSQQMLINGPYNTYFCGAYWRNGFHEDGVVSAINAVEHFKRNLIDEKLHLYRAG